MIKLDWFIRINAIYQSILLVLFSYLFSAFSLILVLIIGIENLIWFDKENNTILEIISAIIIAPFVETFAFQVFPYLVLYNKSIFKNRKWFFILFVSTLFGLIYVYSPSYMLFAFFTVIPFIWMYILLKDNNKSAFWVVCTAHMIRNSVVIIGVLNGMNEIIYKQILDV